MDSGYLVIIIFLFRLIIIPAGVNLYLAKSFVLYINEICDMGEGEFFCSSCPFSSLFIFFLPAFIRCCGYYISVHRRTNVRFGIGASSMDEEVRSEKW